MITEAILALSEKQNLSQETSYQVMDEIMSGKCSPVQIASYLTALSMKGETVDEIVGSAKGMREHALPLNHSQDVLEIVGTGGDHSNSFNISTTSSIVIASAGVPVAKHGNRAASSKSGAADCLEALGVNLMIEPEKNEQVLNEHGICFQFAQKYHTAMKYVAPIRKELRIRTIFNLLGPLTNPAKAQLQVMGVYDESLLEPLGKVLQQIGVKKGMVVYGQDCLDEISMSAKTSVYEFDENGSRKYEIAPEDFGYTRCAKEDLVGGDGAYNAQISKDILSKKEQGPKREAVCLNAGAALYLAGKADTIEKGVRLAESLIDEGKAMAKLEEFVEATNA
jgi:anthranilate phosphoribosyltransferase